MERRKSLLERTMMQDALFLWINDDFSQSMIPVGSQNSGTAIGTIRFCGEIDFS